MQQGNYNQQQQHQPQQQVHQQLAASSGSASFIPTVSEQKHQMIQSQQRQQQQQQQQMMVAASQLDPSSSSSSASPSSSSSSVVTPSDLISQGSSLVSANSLMVSSGKHHLNHNHNKQQPSASNVIDNSVASLELSGLPFASNGNLRVGSSSSQQHQVSTGLDNGNNVDFGHSHNQQQTKLPIGIAPIALTSDSNQIGGNNFMNVQRNGNLHIGNSNNNDNVNGQRSHHQITHHQLNTGHQNGNLIGSLSKGPQFQINEQQQQFSSNSNSILDSNQMRFLNSHQQQVDQQNLLSNSNEQSQNSNQFGQTKTTLLNRLWSIVGRNSKSLLPFANRQPTQNATIL